VAWYRPVYTTDDDYAVLRYGAFCA